jgi:glycosyltransferase involved in cell wall biosynthesis
MTVTAASLKIVHVFRAPLGGLFRHVLDAVRGQIERGHSVGIICDAKAGSAYSESLIAEISPLLGLGLHRFDIKRNPGWGDLQAVRRVRRILDGLGANVVHGHGSKGGLYARLATTRGLDAVVAYTPHGGSFNYRPGTALHKLYMRVEGFLESRTDLFLFESDFIRRAYIGFVGEPRRLVKVVRNGIYPREFELLEPSADAADLVYVGEFRSAKGLINFADSLALVKQALGRPPTVTFIGSGPDEGLLKDRLKSVGLSENAVFLTPRPIREALARGRILVMPSLAESLPYVALEATGAAVPIVSTNVGGIPEIFGPHAGELVPPTDLPRMAEAIVRQINMAPQERREKALAIRDFVKANFTVEGMIEGILSGYAQARQTRGL